MEDRIQINGVWYRREEEITVPKPKLEITRYEGMITESNLYCFKAEKIYKDLDSDEVYEGLDIEFTDKRNDSFEDWDNCKWMIAILNNEPEALETLRESVCLQGEVEFKAFLEVLVEKGWL
jgi:hypothetical protein